MKKFFKYLFILTIMFVLPNFVLAEETDSTFDHIDINKSVSLKYTVNGNEKIYTKTLDSLSDVKLYIIDKDNSNVRTPIDLSGATTTDDTYRINGNFNKLYDGTDTFVKYLVEYTINDTDIYTNLNSNTNKTITYSKEYSFNSENNKSTDGGILIDLQETNSIQNIPTMLTIRKQLEPSTPPGTFTFNIKNTSGTIIKTVNITIPEGSTSKEIYFESININTTYLVEEVPDSKNIYKLKSITSTKGDPTIEHDSNTVTVRATSTEDVITVTAINESAVNHNKDATPNGDGTYQLSLDVTGGIRTDESKVSNANILIIYDVSKSMTSNYVPTSTGRYGLYTGGSSSHGGGASDGTYYTLYDSSGNALTNDTYTGKVYTDRNHTNEYTGQRYSNIYRADAAEYTIRNFINKLVGDNEGSNLYFSFVTFSENATTTKSWTNNASDITNLLSEDGTLNSRELSYSEGTNWEDALDEAKGLLTSESLPNNNPTYVVFVTDGAPSRSNSHPQQQDNGHNNGNNNNNNSNETYYSDALDEARSLYNSAVGTKGDFFSIYAFGKETDWLASLTYYAYKGSEVSSDKKGTTFDTEGYYNASDKDALDNAIASIYQIISTNLGIGAVTISDGTTQSITTSAGVSHLLTVDESSYEYWLTFPVTVKDGNKIIKVNDTEVTVTKNGSNYTLSWTEGETNKSITAPAGSYEKDNTFVYKWTGANDFYNVAPPQAKLESGSVNWVLSKEKVGLLLNNVKYTVTFNVWPSQTTYDLISDFDNGIEDYNDPKYKEIREYLILNDDGSYSLRTNTTAKLTYDDSRDQVGSRDTFFVNPEPVATGVSEVTLEKNWENDLDSREADEIELYLTVDGEDYGEKDEFGNPLPYVLKKTDDWKKDIFISTGLISLDRDTGTAIVREVGHEYGFREKPSDAYYWDLEVAIRRPMVINKAKTDDSEEVELETVMLVKLSDEEKAKLTTADINTLDTKNYLVKEGIEYFRICYRDENGKDIANSCNIYRRATTDESNTISAINHRRSNLNVTKAVDGDYDPDTLFTFNLQVTDKNRHDVWFSIWDKENNGYIINVPGTNYVTGATTDDIVTAEVLTASDSIKNIVYDPNTGKVTYTEDGVNKDYTIIGENPNGTPYTGFFYFNSGNTITVLMKAGWNLRFTNLPNGSTYTFVENLSSAYSLEKVELNKYRKKEGAATPEINEDITLPKSTTVTGEIDKHNLSYTVTYTNEAVKADPVTASKVWEDNNNSFGKRPNSLKLNLLADGKLKETVIVNGPNWNYTWNNLARYNAAGKEIIYTVTETAVDEGDLAYYIPVLNGLTITNYINLTNITVNKDWGTVPQEKRVSIVVGIKSQHDDGKTYQNQTSLTSGNGWSTTFNNVPKYIVIEGVPVIVDGAPVLINYVVDEMSIEGTTLENGVFIEKDTRINAIIGKYTYVVEKTANVYVIRNTYKAMPTKTLIFVKRMNNSEGPVLEGATFALYRFIGEGESGLEGELNIQNLPENWILIGTATSDSEGKFSFSNLYVGEYRLIETIAPANCVLPKGQWIIFLDYKDNNEDEVVIRNNEILSTDESQTGAISIKDDGTIEVINKEIPNIPTTGGIGIPHYNKYGLLLMLLSIGIWLFNILNQRKQIENI